MEISEMALGKILGNEATSSPELKVGSTIMSGGIEYNIVFYNDKNKTYTLVPIDIIDFRRLNAGVLIINQFLYDIVYINRGQKRINIKPRTK